MPIFKHDCNQCEFLGSFTFDSPRFHENKNWIEPTTVDLYICKDIRNKVRFDTFIARRGNEGKEYTSIDRWVVEDHKWLERTDHSSFSPAIVEAYKRANKK